MVVWTILVQYIFRQYRGHSLITCGIMARKFSGTKHCKAKSLKRCFLVWPCSSRSSYVATTQGLAEQSQSGRQSWCQQDAPAPSDLDLWHRKAPRAIGERDSQQLTYGVVSEGVFAESLRKFCGNSAEISRKLRIIAPGKGAEILRKVCGNFTKICGTFSAMTPSRTTP